MQIAMIVLNNLTHDARVEREAQVLSRAGHQVRVIALHKSGLPVEEQREGYQVTRLILKPRRTKGGTIAPILKYAEYAHKIAETTKREPADVYHSHDGNTLLATFAVVRRDRAWWIYDSHELETGRNFGDSHLAQIYQRLWPLPERVFIRRVNAVVSASPSYADQLGEIYGIDRPAVVANCPEYMAPVQSTMLRDMFQLSAQDIVMVYQGGIQRNRGIDVAIQSLQHLESRFHLAIIGGGPALGEFQQLAGELDLHDRVHFTGRVSLSDLPYYTASADLGLTLIQNSCASYYHTLPNKTFEYIMAGIPAVTSDFPAMSTVIRDYQVGELVRDPSSPRQVACAVQSLMSDRGRYLGLCENAHRAARVLNWEHEQRNLLAVYDTIAEGRGR